MKLVRETSPYIRKNVSVARMMIDVLIALLPVLVFAIVQNGWKSVSVILISVFTMLLGELICTMFIKWPEGMKIKELFSKEGFKKLYEKYTINNITAPLISSIIYAMILPAGTNWYVVMIGAVFGIVIGKMLFGGLGSNIFNPAAAGRVFVGICFDSQLVYNNGGVDVAAGGTPLNYLSSSLANINQALSDYSLLDLFLGRIPGSMGEVSALMIIIGGIYLFVRKSADLRPCLSMIASFAVITLVVSVVAANSVVFVDINPLKLFAYEMLSGGLLFGAVFMITDPVTSPTSKFGRIAYGVVVGSLTALIRYAGAYPEGVAFSILLGNMFVPVIDNFLKGANNSYNWKQALGVVLAISVISLILGISVSNKTDENYDYVKDEMFEDFNGLNSYVVDKELSSKLLVKKVVAENFKGDCIGYVYEAKYIYDNPWGGLNEYTVMIGIDSDLELAGIKLIEVVHSWAPMTELLEEHLENKYPDGLKVDDVKNVDLTSGATGAAGFIKELVLAAYADCSGGAQ